MGTNYYLEPPPRKLGEQAKERLHIGKSSAGWCFSLHVIPDEGLDSLAAWVERWSSPGWEIFDEYGKPITPADMLKTITGRSWNTANSMDYESNGAEPGPNGLARHKIGRHCIAHGDGTYDLVAGELSK